MHDRGNADDADSDDASRTGLMRHSRSAFRRTNWTG